MNVKAKIASILVDGDRYKHFVVMNEHGSFKVQMQSQQFSGEVGGTYEFKLNFVCKTKEINGAEYTSQHINALEMRAVQ